MRDVFLVLGPHNREQIAESVGDGSRFGLSVEYLLQEGPLGLAQAVSLAERRVSGPLPRVPRRQPPQGRRGAVSKALRRGAVGRPSGPQGG